MKKILLLVTLLFSFTIAHTQPSDSKIDSNITGAFAVCTPTRDTLYLLNCKLGVLTYNIWKHDIKYSGANPVIILIDDILYYEKKYLNLKN